MKKYRDFIDILKVLIPLYKTNKNSLYLKKILVITVRTLEYVSGIKASKEAQKEANRMRLGKLIKYKWEQQTINSGMKDKGRKIFHWEHYYPVNQIIKELVKLEKLDDRSIYKIIKKTNIVWILKSENKKLDKIAKSTRPNPKLSYKKAGIVIVK